MLSHNVLNKFYVVLRVNFDTSLNKTDTGHLSILIFARPFPEAIFRTRTTVPNVCGKWKESISIMPRRQP